jgi:hypothetical protein
MHGWTRTKTLPTYAAKIFEALKPGGVLAVEQHRAPEGANPEEIAPKGYVPEAWLIQQLESAGFKLDKKSEVNANPKDTKDHEDGVWSLPPTLSGGDKDKDKYLAIGESDRMTLRFVKPKSAKGAKASAKAATDVTAKPDVKTPPAPAPAAVAAPAPAAPAPAAPAPAAPAPK